MDKYAEIVSAAHTAATGVNGRSEPTPEQLRSGNYLKGRVTVHGLNIAIETPAGTRRFGKEDGKPWSVICMAHYGDLSGTKGADGDPLDVFVGPWPESQAVYAVNRLSKDGSFDEVKLLICFPDEQAAITAYTNSYERGHERIGSVVRCTIDQLKWWIKYGDTTKPLTKKALPYDGSDDMNEITWDSAANPVEKDLPTILYGLRREDTDGLLLDAVTVADILEDADAEMALDALVVPLNLLERKMTQLQTIMSAVSDSVKPVAMQITPPFKQRGTTNIAAIFELSDGQTVSIFFHNPDTTPNKLTPDDEMVSWKWLLNKKDVTILVAPERGRDLNPREVGRRVMRLADKNSARFASANARKAERMQSIEATKAQVTAKEQELAALESEIVVLTEKVEKKRNTKAPTPSGQGGSIPFMMTVGGTVTIYEGDTANPLPQSWTGICTDGNDVKSFWYIGREGGERSFNKLAANNYADAVAEARARQLPPDYGQEQKPAVVEPQATSANLPVEGDSAEITAILSKHIPALLAAGKRNHGHNTDGVVTISYAVNEYSYDFSVSYHRGSGESGNLLSARGGDWSKLIDAIGEDDAAKIRAIVDDEKASIAAKNESGEYKEHPYNQVTKVVLVWSEGSRDSDKEFATVADLDQWFKQTYASSVRATGGGYSKNKVQITLVNDRGESMTIEPRVDVSASAGDFNPNRVSLQSYLRDDLGYDGIQPRKLTNGLVVYVEIPDGGSAAVVNAPALDPTSPEGYAKVMADQKLQLAYQDQLDSFFQQRIVAVRNALRDLDWFGTAMVFTKGDFRFTYDVASVGAGANVVGLRYEVLNSKDVNVLSLQDDLTKTPAELAAQIDAAAKPKSDAGQAVDAQAALYEIRQFLSAGQMRVLAEGANRGEEKQYFRDKIAELSKRIADMPKTYEQDGKGDQAIAYLHYFRGSGDWYITEKDMEDGVTQAFGLADLGQGGELGYISITELVKAGVELDLHFEPKTLAAIKGGSGSGGVKNKAAEILNVLEGYGWTVADGKAAKKMDGEEYEARFSSNGETLSLFATNDPNGGVLLTVQSKGLEAKEVADSFASRASMTAYSRRIAASATEREDAAEQAAYTPFNRSSIKMPTAVQLSLNKLGNPLIFNYKGVDGWSNGHILALHKPKIVTDAIEKYHVDETNLRKIPEDSVTRVIPRDANLKLEPIALYNKDDTRIEDGKNVKFKASAVILANEQAGVSTAVDSRYFGYFDKQFMRPDYFIQSNGTGAVLVKKGGEIVGVIMPMRLSEPNLLKRAARAAGRDPVAVAEPSVPEVPETSFRHQGFNLYPYHGGKWGVQSIDNLQRELRGERQVGGDSIVDSKEAAIAEAERQVIRMKEDENRLAEVAAREKAEADAEAARIAMFAEFVAYKGYSAATAERARQTLLRQISADGNIMTLKELIEKDVAEGRTVDNDGGDRGLMHPDGRYRSEKQLTKFGVDYAEFLISKNGSGSEPGDLFENMASLPANVRELLESRASDELEYSELQELLKDVEALGYTFEFGLDAQPFGLRKMTDAEIAARAEASGATEQDEALTAASAFLNTVINGSADMMDPDLAERLTEIGEKYEGNAEVMDLFNQAAEAYSNHMIAEAQKALGA
jgi:hypothetical protein